MNDRPQFDLFDVRSEGQAQTGMALPEEGMWSSMNLTQTADAHPVVLWKDKILQGDLWDRGGQLMLLFYCPKCLHQIQITSARKKIEWDAQRGLFVEPFVCTWENADSEGRQDERIIAGINLCRWSVAIDPVVQYVVVDGVEMRVHGVAKGA